MPKNFDNSQLPAITIQQIYKNLLVELPDKEQVQKKIPAFSIPYLGENQLQILVLVNDPSSKYLSDSDFRFLSGILAACKLSLQDIALVNLYSMVVKHFSHLIQSFQPRVVILFGVLPQEIDLPVNFPHFQVQSYSKVSFLSSPDLTTLEGDKLIKSKLWLSLKQIFML